jgi:hypothetical protein
MQLYERRPKNLIHHDQNARFRHPSERQHHNFPDLLGDPAVCLVSSPLLRDRRRLESTLDSGGRDLALGPLLTLIVFEPGKPSLKFDLSCIVLLQLGALLYGGTIINQ